MLCPVDKSTLQTRAEGAAEIVVCELCHGLWFSREQLANFLKVARHANLNPTKPTLTDKAIHLTSTRLCPCCGNKELTARVIDGVEIDLCSQCHGIWLDAGELELIIARYRKKKKSGASGDGWDLSDIPLDFLSDVEFLGGVADLIGDAAGHSSEWASEAASALLSFIGEALSCIDF